MIYDAQPEDFNPKVSVAACFIECGNEVLFVKRAAHVSQPGTWAIPGGKVEKTETPEQTITREIQEECEFSLQNLEFVHTVYIRYPEYDYIYHMFKAVFGVKPKVTLDRDNDAYEWLTRSQANALEAQNQLILDEMPCIQRVYGDNEFGTMLELQSVNM